MGRRVFVASVYASHGERLVFFTKKSTKYEPVKQQGSKGLPCENGELTSAPRTRVKIQV